MNRPCNTSWARPKAGSASWKASCSKLPWQQAREGVRVKLLPQDNELYVCVESQARVGKERSLRRRRLRRLLERRKELQAQRPSYEALLLKRGAAKSEAGRDWSLVDITLPERPAKKARRRERTDFTCKLDSERLRSARRRAGRSLLRSNRTDTDPEKLWTMCLQLTQVEQAFKDRKGDLSVRPIHQQKDRRIEAHIMVSFSAYCVPVTLREKLRRQAPGLTPRQARDHLGKMQMIDVHLPTTEGRELLLRRRTEPNGEQQLLLTQLKLTLPGQPPPKITGM